MNDNADPVSKLKLPSYLVVDKDNDGKVEEWEAEDFFVSNMVTPGKGLTVGNAKFGSDCTTTSTKPGRHPGVDFYGAFNFDTEIGAAYAGVVVEVDNDPYGDFGAKVVIEHDIYGYKFYSIYAHLRQPQNVSLGSVVIEGEFVGYMGNSPNFGEPKPHLHFEVRQPANIWLSKSEIIPNTAESYWMHDVDEMRTLWVDIGPAFGYGYGYPADWPRH